MTSHCEHHRLDSVLLTACVLLAFATRLFVVLSQSDQLTQDRDIYLGIATSIADGRGFCGPNATAPTAFRPPLYPLCLAAGLCLFPPAVAVASLNLLAGLLTVWLTAVLGQALQLGRLRFVAAGLVAVDPLLLRYSSQPMTETFCTCLATVWLWSKIVLNDPARCRSMFSGTSAKPEHPGHTLPSTIAQIDFVEDDERPSKVYDVKAAWICGITFGLLVLSRPTFWPIALFCGLYWLFARRTKLHGIQNPVSVGTDRTGLSACIAVLLVIAPWLLRNWFVFGTPILTTTHGGYTLLLGNNPVYYEQVVHRPWGTAWPDASQQAWETDLRTRMDQALGPDANEIQQDNWQSQQAKANMIAAPWSCAAAAAHRVHSLWNTTPLGHAAEGINSWAIAIVGWYYVCVLGGSFLGMGLVLLRSNRRSWWPLYALIFTVQLVHLFYWTDTRMRAPLTPSIALFASALIAQGRRPADSIPRNQVT